MPRIRRMKSHDSIYHIMCRSISEFNLFRDDNDKNRYLDIISKYCNKFSCTIYAYCLMDNHVHLHFDPNGFDVSKFMQCVNLSYATYYNIKYKRHGHVFQGRFESKVITSDKYNLTVNAYIHNNPKDIENYCGKEYIYPFSSMGIYLGIRKDYRGLVNKDFILNQFNPNDRNLSIKSYLKFVRVQKEKADIDVIDRNIELVEVNEYRSGRRIILRDIKPEKIIDKVAITLGIPIKECILIKSSRKFNGFRTYTAFILRTLGGLGYREICYLMGNISVSSAADLCRRGYELLLKGGVYKSLFDEFVNLNQCA